MKDDVVIDLYGRIIYHGPESMVVDRLLQIPSENGRKVVIGETGAVLSVEDYLSTRTIVVDGRRCKMLFPNSLQDRLSDRKQRLRLRAAARLLPRSCGVATESRQKRS